MKQKITLNMDDLTLGDMEHFEHATGEDLMETLTPKIVMDPETNRPVPDPNSDKGEPLKEIRVTAKAFVGMVYLALKRDDPSLTPEAVREMKLSDLDFEVEEGGNPTDSPAMDESTPPAESTEPTATLPADESNTG